MVRAYTGLLLLASLALCGCSSARDNLESSPSMTGQTQSEFRPELLGCHGVVTLLEYDRIGIQNLMPAGYTASGLVPGFADMNLEVYSCETAVIDNVTVRPNVAMAFVIAWVDAPAEVEAAGEVNVFSLETIVNDEVMAQALKSQGLPVTLGSIALGRGTDGVERIAIEAPGQLSYRETVVRPDGQPTGDTLERIHHYMNQTTRSWFWLNSTTHEYYNDPRDSVLALEGGILGSVAPGSAGHIASASQRTGGSFIFSFGHQSAQ